MAKARAKVAVKRRKSKRSGSKIVENCALYMQHLRAYQGGFEIDHADGDIAQRIGSDHLEKADSLLLKLVSKEIF